MSEEVQPQVCKRCGRVDLAKDLSVSEDVMKEYFRCALGGKPFSKTFVIAEGDLIFTFEAIPAEAELKLNSYINRELQDIDILDLRLLMSLKEIVQFDEQSSGMKSVYNMSAEARAALLENPKQGLDNLVARFDNIMLGVLRRMSITFMILTSNITEAIINKDFYEGVGLL